MHPVRLLFALALSLALLTGCAGTRPLLEVLDTATQYESNLGTWLSFVQGLADAAPDSDGKKKLVDDLELARKLLLAAGTATAGASDLTQQKLDATYADIRSLVDEIVQVAQQLGLKPDGTSPALKSHVAGAPPPAPEPFPLPLCVTRFKEAV